MAALTILAATGLTACATAPPPPVPAPAPEPERLAPPPFEPITFSSGSSELDTAARSSLRRVSTILRSAPWTAWLIEVDGHSDQLGSEEANLRISGLRADAVVAELEFNGVERERMTARAFGEGQPRVSELRLDGTYDPEAAASNRRVEIRLVESP